VKLNPTNYRSEKAPDGTWTIYDVPVFSSHSRTLASGKTWECDAKWLGNALAHAKVRHAEGYMHPAHVRHHGEGSEVVAAGHVRFQRLGALRIGGRETPTLFADLVGVPEGIYQEIRAGKLSYRSAEILDVSSGEIDSLAFLDHEVPFFRYPLLRVAEGADVTTTRPGKPEAALAFCAAGAASAVLFNYSEASPMDPQGKPDDDKDEAKSADTPLLGRVAEALMGIVDMINSEGSAEDDPPAQGPGPVESAAPAAAPVASAAPVADPVAAAARAGQTDAIFGRLAKLEAAYAASQVDARVAREGAKLIAEGFTDKQVQKFEAVTAKSGEAAGLAYAQALRDSGPAVPPPHWGGEARASVVDSPEVTKYAARGPEALQRARDLERSYKAMPEGAMTTTLPEYIAANFNPEA
tara:strand:- start:18924 stop:20153 length:1230 start_codon:yes stop_codon:yes gene_type:complete